MGAFPASGLGVGFFAMRKVDISTKGDDDLRYEQSTVLLSSSPFAFPPDRGGSVTV